MYQPGLGFYSQLFLVEKVTRGWRHIIDLLALNGFVTLTKFQMKTVASVLGSVRKGERMVSIDIKDIYLQTPVHPESWPYLRFCLEGRVYQFRTLCFGLSTAPQAASVHQSLHSDFGVGSLKGCAPPSLPYVDDWLVIAESRTLLLQYRDLILQLYRDLGLLSTGRSSTASCPLVSSIWGC